MYSLFLMAALAHGAASPGADLPAAAAIAPPGSVNGEAPAEAPSKSNGGFFRRLFASHAKDAAPAAPAAAPAPAAHPAATAASSPAKPKGGFFHNFFKCNEYEKVSIEQEKKWERGCLAGPD